LTSKEIIQKARADGRTILTETESKAWIKESGIVVTNTLLAHSKDEAVLISDRMGYPIVLKIASENISHKSDAGGVKVGLTNPKEVESAYQEILSSIALKCPNAKIQGVTVQKEAHPGVEVTIGMYTDPQFGPVLMFGLGGIWVEILKDVSFRIVPLTKKDAASLIREIKGFPLLEGRRGKKASDIKSLEGALMNLSAFVEKNSEIKEIDLNPIFVHETGYVAVDARIILSDV
jgi:acyl-CoA synthetase (NDP forming)